MSTQDLQTERAQLQASNFNLLIKWLEIIDKEKGFTGNELQEWIRSIEMELNNLRKQNSEMMELLNRIREKLPAN